MKFALGVHILIFPLGMRALHHASDEIHGPNTIVASERLGAEEVGCERATAASVSQENCE
jgi:hypothetical protein